MRVVLIDVQDPLFASRPIKKRSKQGRIQVIGYPPLGIMSLSAVLKREGHECMMFDQANPETPNDVIVDEIQRLQPDLVGLSFLSITTYPYAKILARQIRAANAKVKIAFGGVFATFNALEVKTQCTEIDFVCRGDGEQVILDLLDNLEDPSNVKSVTWTDGDGRVRHNLGRPPERDLDQWPFPDREGLPLDFIEAATMHHHAVVSMDRFTTMQTSRGCPWKCIFCDIPTFNDGKWRSRSPEHVVAEMEHLQENGYGGVYFVDDHFLLQSKRIEKICQSLIDGGNTIKWGCEGRVDSVCMQLFPLMAKSQCRTLQFGIESGSQKVLDRLKKDQTLAQIEIAVKNAKKAGIEIVHGFFVIGSPDETEEEMRQTYRFAAKLPLDTFGFDRLSMYRGTPMWTEYLQRGLVDDEKDWSKSFICSELDPTVLSGDEFYNKISADEMRRLMAYKAFHYPIQSLRALWRYGRYMPIKGLLHLPGRIAKFLLGKVKSSTLETQAVAHQDVKSAAVDLTQIPDDQFEAVIARSATYVERISE